MGALNSFDAPTTTSEPVAIPATPGRAWAWNREPLSLEVTATAITWRCSGASDFWRKTEGVASAHSGCSLLTGVDGDFEFELLVQGAFASRYDQVGLMVAASESRWLKAGVEIDGDAWLSAVHTNEESDWSRERWQGREARLRAIRRAGTIEVFVRVEADWRNYRTLYLPGQVGLGPYSCSPLGDGFEASASELKLTV